MRKKMFNLVLGRQHEFLADVARNFELQHVKVINNIVLEKWSVKKVVNTDYIWCTGFFFKIGFLIKKSNALFNENIGFVRIFKLD